MIWNHGEEESNKFLNYLNNIYDKIKFTHEFNKNAINFLDTTVKIDTTRELYPTLYEKPTDTHLYLYYTSVHYKPCHTNGHFGQFPMTIPKDIKGFIHNNWNIIEHSNDC